MSALDGLSHHTDINDSGGGLRTGAEQIYTRVCCKCEGAAQGAVELPPRTILQPCFFM